MLKTKNDLFIIDVRAPEETEIKYVEYSINILMDKLKPILDERDKTII